jgi:hypothetical protein
MGSIWMLKRQSLMSALHCLRLVAYYVDTSVPGRVPVTVQVHERGRVRLG